MTPSFSPFLAHLLTASLARRALLRTDAWAVAPGADDRSQAQRPDAAEAVQPSAPSSSRTVAFR